MDTSPAQTPDAPTASQRQPAGVLTTWVEQLLHKSVAPHAACLLRVSGELGLRAYGREAERLHDALRALSTALTEVDYGLVTQPDGTPHNPPDLEGFAPLYRAVTVALQPVDALTVELQAWLEANTSGIKRAQVELKMEQERLEAALVHGDGWLGGAWADLKSRRPAPGDREAIDKLRQLARTADDLGSRLRGMHSAGRAVREACEAAQHVVSSRAALVDLLRDDLKRSRTSWVGAMERMLTAAGAGKVNKLPVQPVAQAEAELRALLDHCITGCARLRQEQRGLQRSLATACEQLRAAMQPVPAPAAPNSSGASPAG
jgi:hypothetical protein